MPNIFLISDTHFGHTNSCVWVDEDGKKMRPFDSVEEMDEALVDRWNKVVRPGDKVYHLGDVCIKRSSLPILSRLNGKKVLIKGNHDILKLREYLPYFYDIRGAHRLDRLLLSHIPIHPDSLEGRAWAVNVHGHLHTKVISDPRYFNVCVERHNFTPLAFEEITQQLP